MTYKDIQLEIDNIEYETEQELVVEISRLFNTHRDVIAKEVTKRQIAARGKKSLFQRFYEFMCDISIIDFGF